MTKRETAINDRLSAVNSLIETIALCGRNFMCHKGCHGRLERDGRGKIWYFDPYTHVRIYTHYQGRWNRNYTEGGTMRRLIEQFRDFVVHGKLVPSKVFGPWPDWYCGWGYSDEDMTAVHEKAIELGVIQQLAKVKGEQGGG